MDSEEHRQSRTDPPTVSRRAVVAGGSSALVAALGVSPVASAQVTTDAALPSSAPTMDRDDYTGLLVQVVRPRSDADTEGVDACRFVVADETPVAYEIHLIDRIEDDHRSVTTTLFAAGSDEDIEDGKLFVVNTQERCSDEFVSVNLEQVGASSVGSPSQGAGEGVTAGAAGVDTDTTPTPTGSAAPGFGAGTALGALGAATLAALRRALRR